MANYYVYSGAAGAGTGADWTNAFTTLSAAFTAGAAGDTFYVADDHGESQSSAMSLTSPGTAASPCRVLCVRRSGGSVPPVSADLRTTGSVVTTAGGAINLTGFTEFYGLTISAGTSGNGGQLNIITSTSAGYARFEQCLLRSGSSSTVGNNIVFCSGSNGSSSNQKVVLVNTNLQFSATGQSAVVNGTFEWSGGALQGSTYPTTLFTNAATNNDGVASIRGVDFSPLGSGKSLISLSSGGGLYYLFENCKLGSGVSITTGSIAGQGGVNVRLVNCDSGNTNCRYYKQVFQGTITQETAIVRTGGANDGNTQFSRKMVSTADSKFFSPLESDRIVFWNTTIGSSITVTIEVITDGVTLTDAEAWLEAEYLGTSDYPISSIVTDRAADVLASGTNQTSSSETWTTTGLSSPVKQKLSVTFTPQMRGPVSLRVMLAKDNTTMYFCPKEVVS